MKFLRRMQKKPTKFLRRTQKKAKKFLRRTQKKATKISGEDLRRNRTLAQIH
jgi:hypothetical protein